MAFSAGRKTCIVVGLGRGGIGDAIAAKFSREGYNVAMVARSSLAQLEKEIANSKSYQCDAADADQVASTLEAIRKDLGEDDATIDALMYNVGSGVFKPLEQISYQDFETSWKVGPGGLFLWTKACLPYMPVNRGASIGVTGATASWRGMPYTPAFASAKMATRGLVQSLARDLGPNKGIHVFHVVIDGAVNLKSSSSERPANEMLDPDAIAETYWQLHNQPVSCWTQETHVAAQGAFGSIASI